MVVVPKEDQINENVAQKFFELTFGTLGSASDTGARIFNAFLAISSLGNIIVMVSQLSPWASTPCTSANMTFSQTYTAARVKQEIAKEVSEALILDVREGPKLTPTRECFRGPSSLHKTRI